MAPEDNQSVVNSIAKPKCTAPKCPSEVSLNNLNEGHTSALNPPTKSSFSAQQVAKRSKSTTNPTTYACYPDKSVPILGVRSSWLRTFGLLDNFHDVHFDFARLRLVICPEAEMRAIPHLTERKRHFFDNSLMLASLDTGASGEHPGKIVFRSNSPRGSDNSPALHIKAKICDQLSGKIVKQINAVEDDPEFLSEKMGEAIRLMYPTTPKNTDDLEAADQGEEEDKIHIVIDDEVVMEDAVGIDTRIGMNIAERAMPTSDVNDDISIFACENDDRSLSSDDEDSVKTAPVDIITVICVLLKPLLERGRNGANFSIDFEFAKVERQAGFRGNPYYVHYVVFDEFNQATYSWDEIDHEINY